LDDDQAWVRAASVRAIAEHGGERALNALMVALKDPVPEVRETARLVMNELDGQKQEEEEKDSGS
jgi:HEAT repeat protein